MILEEYEERFTPARKRRVRETLEENGDVLEEYLTEEVSEGETFTSSEFRMYMVAEYGRTEDTRNLNLTLGYLSHLEYLELESSFIPTDSNSSDAEFSSNAEEFSDAEEVLQSVDEVEREELFGTPF